jgi:hypothetical protein
MSLYSRTPSMKKKLSISREERKKKILKVKTPDPPSSIASEQEGLQKHYKE